MVAESSILLRIQNCTEEEETRVSELLVESVRNQILQSNHEMSGESLRIVESAVRDAFGNIQNGKMKFTNTLSNVLCTRRPCFVTHIFGSSRAVHHFDFNFIIPAHFSNAEQGCVILYPDFDTFAAFLNFLDDIFTNKITECFSPVQYSLRKHFSLPDLTIEAVMNAKQFAYCFEYISKDSYFTSIHKQFYNMPL